MRRGRIDLIVIPDSLENYDELIELQKDAKRVIQQCAELKEINPQFSAKYDAQLLTVLEEIDKQAEEVATRDKKKDEA